MHCVILLLNSSVLKSAYCPLAAYFPDIIALSPWRKELVCHGISPGSPMPCNENLFLVVLRLMWLQNIYFSLQLTEVQILSGVVHSLQLAWIIIMITILTYNLTLNIAILTQSVPVNHKHLTFLKLNSQLLCKTGHSPPNKSTFSQKENIWVMKINSAE